MNNSRETTFLYSRVITNVLHIPNTARAASQSARRDTTKDMMPTKRKLDDNNLMIIDPDIDLDDAGLPANQTSFIPKNLSCTSRKSRPKKRRAKVRSGASSPSSLQRASLDVVEGKRR